MEKSKYIVLEEVILQMKEKLKTTGMPVTGMS